MSKDYLDKREDHQKQNTEKIEATNPLDDSNPPLEKSKDLLEFEWERKQWKEQTRYLYRPRIRWW
jgi:hypothetical protein